ncbi:MAG: acyl-CoA dehydrogenase family protein [Burkholderiaceae bacterium]|jgi:alkylation response protein AidB-like acyl-CoA dehydrogenase|nr:acyl-CoA dehydrogenase family protein [Burkholderiaceae bacterium]MEB2320515.1 acyl-CoA dehydrogenase family protein [Pseudomonadota bacterium]
MNLSFSPEETAFRDQVRSWFEANLPSELRDDAPDYRHYTREELVRWYRILAKQGWLAPSWPVEWGGTDWNAAQKYIYDEEYARAGAPPVHPFGTAMCGPVLLRFGTEEQKRRFLPRIYNSDDLWCQGYSEPGSGSDLASLKTRAERRGDHYIVNGQKIWTSMGHYADWIFCLVRTDTSSPKKQDGISFLLIDMKTPGITVRPLILLEETHHVNEVFFEDVKVPVENLVHEEGKGWTVAKHLLGHERLNTSRIGNSRREIERLKKLARKVMQNGRPLIEDPRFADRLARVEIELMALEISNLQFVDEVIRTGQISSMVSMLKIRGTDIQQAITELLMDAYGPQARAFRAIDHDGFDARAAASAPIYFNYRKTTIYAGSNEVQRNIISKAALGL